VGADVNAVYVILLLPLVGFGVLLCGGKYLRRPAPGVIATLATGGAFVAAVITFFALHSRASDDRSVTKPIFTWIQAGNFQVKVSVLVDPLSVTMVLFVTGVSTLIHLYSIGYMKNDAKFRQFFIYLNLFVFSMVTLVLADNFVFLFLGWDGVALCSYLLISFWFERERAAVAGKKAFVTNRIADVGLMVAMFLIFSKVGSLTFKTVFAHHFSPYTAGAIGILMFITACGKSAQLPLYVWLPDAMEGPTPVSALIHAATMVTAGVYLMARVSPILHTAEPVVLTIIAIVGCATALFAATIACAQDDIKKVLAYSTISQLGYMFLAVGSGAYVAALFHMITHAFFKACLFLGAGSVIHGMHDEQDMKRMGALRKWMPVTAMAFMVSWLAIAGIPPFSGFWSKDDILAAAWQKNPAFYVVGALTAGLTAYYMTRQVWLTFFGTPRWRDDADEPSGAGATEPEPVAGQAGHEEHVSHGRAPHESPWTMTVPLGILGVLAAIGGIINLPFGNLDFLARWLDPLLGPFSTVSTVSTGTKVGLAVLTTALCVAGIGIGIRIWSRSAEQPKLEPEILQRAWYVDDAYSVVFGEGGEAFANEAALVDSKVIDGAVNGAGVVVEETGGLLRRLQTGYVRNYALGITAGAVLVLGWALYIRIGS
jgi:NADH-quinone oxidoreductase subunit L